MGPVGHHATNVSSDKYTSLLKFVFVPAVSSSLGMISLLKNHIPYEICLGEYSFEKISDLTT